MVKYMGSKAAHADEIVAIATANRRPGQAWVEPFVGGGNVIVRVDPERGPRIGSDLNWRMIRLLDGLGNRGWLPPEQPVTEELFNAIKQDPDAYEPELVAFVATGMTFGSTWFGTFARGEGREGPRDYFQETRRFALREAPLLRGVKFLSVRYEDLTPHVPSESVVYCDPPYSGTTGYGGARTDVDVGQPLSLNTWDRVKFWRWADAMVEAGHRVYVSEYAGPPASTYRVAPDAVAAARLRAVQADPGTPRSDVEAAVAAVRAAERLAAAERGRLASRWVVTWEKEVASSFDSGRGTDGKREVEKLFHRAP